MVAIKSKQKNKRQQKKNKRQLENDESGALNKKSRSGGESVEVRLLVQSNAIGQVIGKGGETIKSIREEAGASVYTSKFMKDVSVRTVKLSGTVEQVCTAIRMIIDKVAKDSPTVTLLAEQRNIGGLIGKQGAKIKQLREESGARIFITQECIGNSSQKEIEISGDYESVTKAVEEVVSQLSEARNPTYVPYIPGDVQGATGGLLMPPSFGGVNQAMGFQKPVVTSGGPSVCRIETTMWVPREVIGQVIGRGGSNIKAVRMQSSANIFVDAGEDGDETPERMITIKGSREAINVACMLIENLVNQRQ